MSFSRTFIAIFLGDLTDSVKSVKLTETLMSTQFSSLATVPDKDGGSAIVVPEDSVIDIKKHGEWNKKYIYLQTIFNAVSNVSLTMPLATEYDYTHAEYMPKKCLLKQPIKL